MKQTKVSELKAHLSARLAEVRKGATIVVCDRNTPIAKLVPCDDDTKDVVIEEPAESTVGLSRLRGVTLAHKTEVLSFLREDRDGR